MHMVSDHFTDANKDIFILKRQTDAANNTMQLSLDGTTPLNTNTPPLANDSVAFASGTIFGQETSNNTYVYAVKFDLIITTSSTGTPTVASERKIIVRNNPPGSGNLECGSRSNYNWWCTIFYFSSVYCDYHIHS